MAKFCLKVFIVLMSIIELFSGLSIAGLAAAFRALVVQVPTAIMRISADAKLVSNMADDYKTVEAGLQFVSKVATGVIAFGLLLVVVSMLGMYGACCESTCMLNTYMPSMGLLAAGDIVVGVLLLVGRAKAVDYFDDVVDCSPCTRIVYYISTFARPSTGVSLFAAVPKIFAVYCAWRIVKKLKEKREDKKLMRNFLRGHARPQPATQQPIVIVTGGGQAPAPPVQPNIVAPVFMPMTQYNMVPNPMMAQQPISEKDVTDEQPKKTNNLPNKTKIPKSKAKAKISTKSIPPPPPPPPPPPIGYTPIKYRNSQKSVPNVNLNNETGEKIKNTDLNPFRPVNPTPNTARKYNNLSESLKRSNGQSNVRLDDRKVGKSENKTVRVIAKNISLRSQESVESQCDNVFVEDADSQIVVNRTRLSSLPSEYRRTFGSGTSGMVSVVEEDCK